MNSPLMSAARIHRYGGPDELRIEQLPIPQPGPGEVLVRVMAAGVGLWDALVRSGSSSLDLSLPLTLGSEIAGVVAGSGQEIYGTTNSHLIGGYAQYAVVDRSMIAPKPRSFSFVEAASAPMAAVTAWQMLFEYAHVVEGQSVLVHDGAGDVGSYAVQLAHRAGARVIAVVDTSEVNHVRDLGADQLIDFRQEAFEDRAAGVDVVIDSVGGKVQQRSFSVLKPGGILVSDVSPPSKQTAASRGVRVDFVDVRVTAASLAGLTALFDAGILKNNLGVVLSLADVRRAHEILAGTISCPRGKIVLDVALSKDPVA